MEGKVKQGALGVPGNEGAQSRILSYLNGGRIHPAVIVGGPEGSGKFRVAKNIAKFFLCTKRPSDGSPFCDGCSACRRVEKEVHPDLLIYRELEEDTIKIDTVRQLCHQMELTPVEGKAKICIVDACHRMNTAAANAFLKTLEEPGPDRYFWLLTPNMSGLLPTLLSRCLKFSFKPENGITLPVEVEAAKNYETLYQDFLSKKDAFALASELDSKEKTLEFVHFLQTRLRMQVLTPSEYPTLNHPALYESLALFEETLVLEGRLRSNANYGLMLESFLSRQD